MKSRHKDHYVSGPAARLGPAQRPSSTRPPGRRVDRRTPSRASRVLRWAAATLILLTAGMAGAGYVFYAHLSDNVGQAGQTSPAQTPTPTVTATASIGPGSSAGQSSTPSPSSIGAAHPYAHYSYLNLMLCAFLLMCVVAVGLRAVALSTARGAGRASGRAAQVGRRNYFEFAKIANSIRSAVSLIVRLRGGTPWLSNYVEGLGRTFDLFGVIPPLEQEVLPSFESTLLEEAYQLACTRGFSDQAQDQEHGAVR